MRSHWHLIVVRKGKASIQLYDLYITTFHGRFHTQRAVGNIYWIWWGKRGKRDRETHKVGQLERWEGVNMIKIYWNSQRIKKYYFKKLWLWVTLGLFPILKIFAANSSQQLKKKKKVFQKSLVQGWKQQRWKCFLIKFLKKKKKAGPYSYPWSFTLHLKTKERILQ